MSEILHILMDSSLFLLNPKELNDHFSQAAVGKLLCKFYTALTSSTNPTRNIYIRNVWAAIGFHVAHITETSVQLGSLSRYTLLC